ncbi:MAG: PSD1 and planctomycete cytochrome C domain-containing protein [Pirellula sp.]|nr:PSD1 and planctomycete cytochrome C domain-containing protein [Pirellula sp.]
MIRVLSLWCLIVLSQALVSVAIADDGPDFRTQIQPILAEHCSQCHGVDESTREGGLRLDVRGSALEGGDSGQAAIVPGHAPSSELVRRILSSDADEMMPPPSMKKPLSDQQKQLLQEWINAGANYEEHWAFVPPRAARVDLDRSIQGKKYNNATDWLIAETLDQKGWRPNGRAEDWELCRRVYLDVIGVPPTPEQLEAFSRDGLESTIDRLLADERYGEKWARPWLDVARYSDTNGYEKDLQREQWAWRDWVIDAISRDMPYDQFVIEQIAGDLLPDATQDQLIATGFLRNSMINEEGAIVPEQFRMVEMFDRMDCVGKAVLGLSLQCAQCHTHKFDPITHDEYYGLFASLNNTYEARSWIYTPEHLEVIQNIRRSMTSELESYQQSNPSWRANYAEWRTATLDTQPAWRPLHAELLETISGLNHPVQEQDESILMLGHTSNDVFMIAPATLDRITGLRFEVLTHGELPFRGPGRNGVGLWDLKELELLVQRPGSSNWEKIKLASATADYSSPDEKSADGKNASGPVSYLIDGKDETVWKADRGLGRRNQSSVAVVQLETPLEGVRDCKLKVVWRQGDMVGCCRISVTDAPNPIAPEIDHDAMLALARPDADAVTSDRVAAGTEIADRVLLAWLRTRGDATENVQRIEALWKQFPQAKTSVLHMAEREPDRSRQTYTLQRGNWDQPLDPVNPTMLTSFHTPDSEEDPPRLRLARWLADRESPLTARVAVNRVWQNVFGEGLVETSEDFGSRAPVPEHQAVLDTLAVQWMEQGWSQKRLLKSILMTEAYQRSSKATPELMEVDPRNRWLTRGPRFRCDAESIRDIVLSAAGLLHHRVGGPSVIPPVPQNVLDYNYTYPSYWQAAAPPERYRRAVYMFRKRSMPDPVLNVFDAPNGDVACARRMRSNTPLSALAGLNEPVFFEAAQGLAMRILKEVHASDGDSELEIRRLHRAFLLTTSRLPSSSEQQTLLQFLASQRKRLADGWLNPREILTGDPAKLNALPEGATPQDAAAWTLVSRVILNLDATITK